MSHLTLLAPSSPSVLRPALAHDIRNAMAVIALNVEKLEHLAESAGVKAVHQRSPLAPAPLQSLRHYYGLLRPCPPLWYSRSRGWSRLWLVP
jgi:hypothetical protein